MNELIPLTALWRHLSKDGQKVYYTGRLGEAKILMFEVQSDNPRAPAFKIMLAKPNQPEQRGYQEEDRPFPNDPGQTTGTPQPIDDSDLPF